MVAERAASGRGGSRVTDVTGHPAEMHDDAGTRSVRRWVLMYAQAPETPEFATRHLDELVWEHPHGVDVVADALACLIETVAARAQVGAPDVDVRLALPLRESESMDRQVPSWANLRADMREGEPPSIYISSHRDHFLSAFPEEFRAPMQPPATLSGGSAHYVCARDGHSAAMGWEFTRTVWVHVDAD